MVPALNNNLINLSWCTLCQSLYTISSLKVFPHPCTVPPYKAGALAHISATVANSVHKLNPSSGKVLITNPFVLSGETVLSLDTFSSCALCKAHQQLLD